MCDISNLSGEKVLKRTQDDFVAFVNAVQPAFHHPWTYSNASCKKRGQFYENPSFVHPIDSSEIIDWSPTSFYGIFACFCHPNYQRKRICHLITASCKAERNRRGKE